MATLDKRRHTRLPLELKMEYQTSTGIGYPRLKGHTVDLSQSGMSVQLDKATRNAQFPSETAAREMAALRVFYLVLGFECLP